MNISTRQHRQKYIITLELKKHLQIIQKQLFRPRALVQNTIMAMTRTKIKIWSLCVFLFCSSCKSNGYFSFDIINYSLSTCSDFTFKEIEIYDLERSNLLGKITLRNGQIGSKYVSLFPSNDTYFRNYDSIAFMPNSKYILYIKQRSFYLPIELFTNEEGKIDSTFIVDECSKKK